MKYYSLHHNASKVSFKEAVLRGLAPDRGIYFPEKITPLPSDFIKNIASYSREEIAFEAIKQFVGNDIPKKELQTIITETLSFDFPVIPIEEKIAALELFHGPTMAFKDVGARFMARCLGYFNRDEQRKITVLVATSGDTGGAVANGFLGVEGVDVVILYPSGKVSEIQEKQLTTLGQNITALEVQGTFDDCQDMVKTAFLDATIQRTLTSANSINVARWLPQMFYYFFAYQSVYKKHPSITFSVPSGNFGNICAGLLAKQLGLPVKHFIAATNSNDAVMSYLKDGKFTPKKSVATISNAMDVGNPSNFIRILELYEQNHQTVTENLSAYSFSDEHTKTAIRDLHEKYKYITDPHGAVGYLGLKAHELHDSYGIFLETAHPVKFLPVMKEVLQQTITIPKQVKAIMHKEKKAHLIHSYEELKEFLTRD